MGRLPRLGTGAGTGSPVQSPLLLAAGHRTGLAAGGPLLLAWGVPAQDHPRAVPITELSTQSHLIWDQSVGEKAQPSGPHSAPAHPSSPKLDFI